MKKIIWILVFLLFIASFAFAQLKVTLNSPTIYPGKCLKIVVGPQKDIKTIEGNFLGQKFNFFPLGNKFRGIVGVSLEQKPATYPLLLKFTKKDGAEEKIRREVKVVKYKFPKVSFRLKPAKSKLLVQELIQKEWAEIEKALLVERERQYWKGKFIKPTAKVISQSFGTVEYINGKKRGQHRGIDFALMVGSKIIAPNEGEVVFVDYLKAFGGTLILDHGQGIHSFYFHLSKSLKKIGEVVNKGEVIALSGDSGISSGPHLHWGFSVHNLRVDPLPWTKQEM